MFERSGEGKANTKISQTDNLSKIFVQICRVSVVVAQPPLVCVIQCWPCDTLNSLTSPVLLKVLKVHSCLTSCFLCLFADGSMRQENSCCNLAVMKPESRWPGRVCFTSTYTRLTSEDKVRARAGLQGRRTQKQL